MIMKAYFVFLIIAGVFLAFFTVRGIVGEIELYRQETYFKEKYGAERTWDSLVAGIVIWPLCWGIYIFSWLSYLGRLNG